MRDSLGVSVARQMNDWVRGEVRALAVAVGMQSFPMQDPDFDFYFWSQKKAWRMSSFLGQNLDCLVCDAIRMVFWKEQGEERYGKFFNYYDKFLKNPEYSADYHFKLCFRHQVLTLLRRKQRDRFVFDGYMLIFEGVREPMDTELSPDLQCEIDEIEKRVLRDIARLFSRRSDRKVLIQVCKDYFVEQLTLVEIADRLNSLSVMDCAYLPPRGGVWHEGQVGRKKLEIKDMLSRYFASYRLDEADVGRILSSHTMIGVFNGLS